MPIKQGDIYYMDIGDKYFIGVVEKVVNLEGDGASSVYVLYSLSTNEERYFPYIIDNKNLKEKISNIKAKRVKNRVEYYKSILINLFPERYV